MYIPNLSSNPGPNLLARRCKCSKGLCSERLWSLHVLSAKAGSMQAGKATFLLLMQSTLCIVKNCYSNESI